MKTYIFAALFISLAVLGAPRAFAATMPTHQLSLIEFATTQNVRKGHPTELTITLAPQPAGTTFIYNALWGDEGGKPTDDHSEFYVASSTRTATTTVVTLAHTYRKAGNHKVLLTIQSSLGAVFHSVSHTYVER